MKYILDTCIISYLFRGVPSVIQKFQENPPSDLCISTLTFMEIEFGLSLDKNRSKKLRPKWEQLIQLIHILPFEQEDAKIAGEVRANLQKRGEMIGPYDVLIASVALRRSLICVTHNIKEFDRVSFLEIEDWYEI